MEPHHYRRIVSIAVGLAVMRALMQPGVWERGLCAEHVDSFDRAFVVAVGFVASACNAQLEDAGKWWRSGGWLLVTSSLVIVSEESSSTSWMLHDWLLRAGSLAWMFGLWRSSRRTDVAALVTLVLAALAFATFFVFSPRVWVALVLASASVHAVRLWSLPST